jgi:hypothetical protein
MPYADVFMWARVARNTSSIRCSAGCEYGSLCMHTTEGHIAAVGSGGNGWSDSMGGRRWVLHHIFAFSNFYFLSLSFFLSLACKRLVISVM